MCAESTGGENKRNPSGVVTVHSMQARAGAEASSHEGAIYFTLPQEKEKEKEKSLQEKRKWNPPTERTTPWPRYTAKTIQSKPLNVLGTILGVEEPFKSEMGFDEKCATPAVHSTRHLDGRAYRRLPRVEETVKTFYLRRIPCEMDELLHVRVKEAVGLCPPHLHPEPYDKDKKTSSYSTRARRTAAVSFCLDAIGSANRRLTSQVNQRGVAAHTQRTATLKTALSQAPAI